MTCRRCHSLRRKAITVVNASTREHILLCAKCITNVLQQLGARSRRVVSAIVQQRTAP